MADQKKLLLNQVGADSRDPFSHAETHIGLELARTRADEKPCRLANGLHPFR